MKEWMALLISYCWTIPLCIYLYNHPQKSEKKSDRFLLSILLGGGGYAITNLILTVFWRV